MCTPANPSFFSILNEVLRGYAFHGHVFLMKMKTFSCKITPNFHIFAQFIACGYMLEPPRRGVSNEYPQSMFWIKNKK